MSNAGRTARVWPVGNCAFYRVSSTAITSLCPGTLFQSALITAGILSVWDAAADGLGTALSGGVAVGVAAAELGLEDRMFLGFAGNSPTPSYVFYACFHTRSGECLLAAA